MFCLLFTLSCSPIRNLDKSYKYVGSNGRVISERLKLNSDRTFDYSIIRCGEAMMYYSNVTYKGEYRIKKNRVVLELDSLEHDGGKFLSQEERRNQGKKRDPIKKFREATEKEKVDFKQGNGIIASTYKIVNDNYDRLYVSNQLKFELIELK